MWDAALTARENFKCRVGGFYIVGHECGGTRCERRSRE
jgi:hypothetical protein